MKVSLITCTEVSNASRFIHAVKTAYPSARLFSGPGPQTMLVAISGLNWTIGHASFFADLRRHGMIGGFTHKSYTDWSEEVLR